MKVRLKLRNGVAISPCMCGWQGDFSSNHSILCSRLQCAAHPVHRRLCGRFGVHGDGVGDIGVVAFSPEDGIVAARFQGELPVFLRIAQDAEAAAERLDRILELLNHALNEDFRIGAYTFCPRKKIRLIPVAIITVLPGHVGRNDHPAFRRIAPFMGAHKIAMLVVHIYLPGPGADFKRFLEMLARHGIVHLVEGEGEIRANLNAFPFQILILRIRQREQSIPFLGLEQIPSGITEPLEGLTILLLHLLPQNGVQLVEGVEGHLIHLNQDVHGDNLHMPFNIRLPAGLSDLGRHDDGAVVLRPGLEILVDAGVDPVLVLR